MLELTQETKQILDALATEAKTIGKIFKNKSVFEPLCMGVWQASSTQLSIRVCAYTMTTHITTDSYWLIEYKAPNKQALLEGTIANALEMLSNENINVESERKELCM